MKPGLLVPVPEGFKPTSSVLKKSEVKSNSSSQPLQLLERLKEASRRGHLAPCVQPRPSAGRCSRVPKAGTREQQNLDCVTTVCVLLGGGLGSGGSLLMMIIRGEHFLDILCV